MLAAGEAFKRRLARVAGGGHEDEVVVVEPALFAQLARRMLEEAGQALQGHVLEGRGGSMEQLEHMDAVAQVNHGGDTLVVKLGAVGAGHEGVDCVVGDVDLKCAIDARGALGVRKLGKRANLFDAHRGNLLGHEKAATGGNAFDDSLAK